MKESEMMQGAVANSAVDSRVPPFILVASDMHLGDGTTSVVARSRRNAVSAACPDEAFARWLAYFASNASEGGLLILNGDTFDFTRVMRVPTTPSDYAAWGARLPDSERALANRKTISRRERRFGLDSQPFKSVWKLHVVLEQHAPVFRALADWVARGGLLLFVKGNHDLELHWSGVCAAIQDELHKQSCTQESHQSFAARISFADDGFNLGNLWIEHGHRWEKLTAVHGPPISSIEPDQLNMPRGHRLSRYVVNVFERFHSRVVGNHARLFARLGLLALCLVTGAWFATPSVLDTVFDSNMLQNLFIVGMAAVLIPGGAELVRALGQRYITGSSIDQVFMGAREVLEGEFPADSAGFPVYAVMGHSHVPEARAIETARGQRYYVNSGMWQPSTPADVANDALRRCHSYVEFRLRDNKWYQHAAMLWDDATGRPRQR